LKQPLCFASWENHFLDFKKAKTLFKQSQFSSKVGPTQAEKCAFNKQTGHYTLNIMKPFSLDWMVTRKRGKPPKRRAYTAVACQQLPCTGPDEE